MFTASTKVVATYLGIAGKDDPTKVANLLTGLDQLKQKVGIPLTIKGTGQDESLFMSKIDSIADSYISHLGPAVDKLTPERRRASGVPMSATEVRELLVHAWNGTRAELV